MKNVAILLFITLLFLLSACSESPYDGYIGYWVETQNSSSKVNFFEIRKIETNYVIEQNELGTLDPKGGNKDIVLTSDDGALILYNTFPIALSDDQNELIITGVGTMKRLTNIKFEELLAAETKQLEDETTCGELNRQFKKESPLIFVDINPYKSEKEQAEEALAEAKREKVREKYVALSKEAGLTDCRIR